MIINNWFIENKDWLLSGIGVTIFQEIRVQLKKRIIKEKQIEIKELKIKINSINTHNSIKQTVGNNTTNPQAAGGNIYINEVVK